MGRYLVPVVVSAALAAAHPAAAQQAACSARAEVLKHLSAEYAEAPVAMGIANNGGVVEILSSKAGRSWTIILTLPNGLSCLIAAGENWEAVPDIIGTGPKA